MEDVRICEDRMSIYLRSFKTDQAGHGPWIILGALAHQVCLMQAVGEFLSQSSFLLHADGASLSGFHFSSVFFGSALRWWGSKLPVIYPILSRLGLLRRGRDGGLVIR